MHSVQDRYLLFVNRNAHGTRNARFTGNETKLFQPDHHAVNRRSRNLKIRREVRLGGPLLVKFTVKVDVCQKLPLTTRDFRLGGGPGASTLDVRSFRCFAMVRRAIMNLLVKT